MRQCLASLQFIDYRIIDMSFVLNEDFAGDGPFSFGNNLAVEVGIGDEETHTVTIRYEINENPEDFPFSLKLAIKGRFRIDNGISSGEVHKLLSYNGVAVLFPYMRAAISQITNMAGVSPLLIPLVNVQDLMDYGLEESE